MLGGRGVESPEPEGARLGGGEKSRGNVGLERYEKRGTRGAERKRIRENTVKNESKEDRE